MKILLELEVEILPEELQSEEKILQLIEIFKTWIPKNLDDCIACENDHSVNGKLIKDTDIPVHLMNVSFVGKKKEQEQNGN